MVEQSRDTVPQDRNSAERKVLLGQRCAEACSAAGRDDKGDAGGHRRNLSSALEIAKPMSAWGVSVASQQKPDRMAMKY
jgi:hypothetical protein